MLYIHIPYCRHRCTYCAFFSRAARGVEEAYLSALCRELTLRCHEQTADGEARGKHALTTVYIGGGTPSLLSLPQLERLLACLEDCFDLSRLQEVTLECNPESLSRDYLRDLQGLHFVNRLSIGVQSFCDEELRRLNRLHTGRQAILALQEARRQGFDNLSADLIYGLPGQSLAAWQRNLELMAQLPVSHLSCYSLTVEPASMLSKQIAQGLCAPPDEAAALRQYDDLLRWAAAQDFEQYEISNFCRAGQRSLHNSRYWTRTPYLGCGAAAHSFDGQRRRWNVADTQQYIQAFGNPDTYYNKESPTPGNGNSPASYDGKSPAPGNAVRYYEEETLSPADTYNEMVMLGLRTTAGISKADVAAPLRPGLHAALAPFISNRLIEETATHYRPTAQGLLHADGISEALFLSPSESNRS